MKVKKLTKERSDIFSGGAPPQPYRLALAEAGGLNPFGEPNFRLTLAEKTRIFQGAEWSHWPEGAKLKDRGGVYIDDEGRSVPAPPSKPVRVVVEMAWVVRYPDLKGWILQEWFPAHHYGDQATWEAYKVPGHSDLCRLGPYPVEGDYELALPFAWKQAANEEVLARDHRFQGHVGLPTFTALRTAIQYAEYCREFWGKLSPANRIRMREDAMLERQALLEKRKHDQDVLMIRDQMSPLWSNSLEAGRWRQELADKAELKIGWVGA